MSNESNHYNHINRYFYDLENALEYRIGVLAQVQIAMGLSIAKYCSECVCGILIKKVVKKTQPIATRSNAK